MRTATKREPIAFQKVLTAQERWRKDPIFLSSEFFGSNLWAKQIEVMNAVRDFPRVCVKSGNTVGKSKVAAEIMLAFLFSYYPSKVVITAPTFTQIEEIIWKEIAKLYNNAKVPLGGELLKTEFKLNEEWFAIGISTNEVNRFQGFHSPFLLVIIDEALGVGPEIWEAVESLHPYRILAIGNPLVPEGDFYNCFSSPLWKKITVTCEECVAWQEKNGVIPGLVSRQWIEERKEEWGEKSPLYQARVLAEFPQEGTDVLIPLKWVERAREIEFAEEREDSIKIEGCDVARSGNAKTVIVSRFGHTFYDIVAKEKTLVTETAFMLKQNYEKHSADSIVVDDDGCGAGVTDILTAQRIGVWAFHGGWKAKAMDTVHFKNLRSQFYWFVAKKFEKGLYSLKKLPLREYEILKNQLCSLKILPPDERGRIRIETKEDMLARGLKSPDYADAFMMTEYGWYMPKYSDVRPSMYRDISSQIGIMA